MSTGLSVTVAVADLTSGDHLGRCILDGDRAQFPVDSPWIREFASYAITVDVDADTATPSTAFMGLVRGAREHGPFRMPLDGGAGRPPAPCSGGCHATRDPHDGMG